MHHHVVLHPFWTTGTIFCFSKQKPSLIPKTTVHKCNRMNTDCITWQWEQALEIQPKDARPKKKKKLPFCRTITMNTCQEGAVGLDNTSTCKKKSVEMNQRVRGTCAFFVLMNWQVVQDLQKLIRENQLEKLDLWASRGFFHLFRSWPWMVQAPWYSAWAELRYSRCQEGNWSSRCWVCI